MRIQNITLVLALFAFLPTCGRGTKTIPFHPYAAELRPHNQHFHVDPTEKSVVHADKGSVFTIPAGAFKLPDGYKAGDKIEIHIVEATKSSDFAALPVSLEFNDNGNDTLFESAGMFFIQASHSGKRRICRLSQGYEI